MCVERESGWELRPSGSEESVFRCSEQVTGSGILSSVPVSLWLSDLSI